MKDRAGDEWGMERLVAADGACLWRGLRAARKTTSAAISVLGVGRVNRGSDGGVVRIADTRDSGRDGSEEKTVYADDAGRSSWRIVQAFGSASCETAEVVLVLDRRRSAWRSV